MFDMRNQRIYWLHLGFDLLKMHAKYGAIYALLAPVMEGRLFFNQNGRLLTRQSQQE